MDSAQIEFFFSVKHFYSISNPFRIQIWKNSLEIQTRFFSRNWWFHRKENKNSVSNIWFHWSSLHFVNEKMISNSKTVGNISKSKECLNRKLLHFCIPWKSTDQDREQTATERSPNQMLLFICSFWMFMGN